MNSGDADLQRLGWHGFKSVLARVLGSPLLNPLVQLCGRALPKRFHRRLPLNHRHVDYRLYSSGVVRLLDTRHDILARDIFWGRGRPTSKAERHKLKCIERLSRDTAVFLDIGAYAGMCALIAARANPALRAIAYEMVPENYSLVTRNIIENDLVSRVEVRLRAVGALPGTVRLPELIGLPSYPTSMSLSSLFAKGVEIPIVALDGEHFESQGPFLMKIDVEGFEEQVFAGARAFIAGNRPPIICEVLPQATAACASIVSMLAPLGYRWFEIEDAGVVLRERFEPRNEPRDWLLTTQAYNSASQ